LRSQASTNGDLAMTQREPRPGFHSVTPRIVAPLDTPYGDRRAMVRDPFGNVFQVAHPQ
jgi:hypothetical protein